MVDLQTWIARAITERSKENPVAFNTLLELLRDQPDQAIHCLPDPAGFGNQGFERPASGVRSLPITGNPKALKLSVCLGMRMQSGRWKRWL